MSIIKSYKCDFCGVIKTSESELSKVINDMHCCLDCKETVQTVLYETANYIISTGEAPCDMNEFSRMMYNLSLNAKNNLKMD